MDYGTIEAKEGDNVYEKKLNPNSPRYEAASIECGGGTGGIISMVNCSQFCEVYKVDRTFHIQTPEVLDPEQINPNMGFVKIEKSTVGCGNKIVARLMVQSQELLKILPSNINQMILSDKLYECKELLLICDKIATDISNEVNLINLKISENKLSNVNRRIMNLPRIEDLDDRVSRFLVNAKKYIQTLAEIFNIFFNEDVDGPRVSVNLKVYHLDQKC